MRLLVLGASGMLGHAVFLGLLRLGWDVYGSARDAGRLKGHLPDGSLGRIVSLPDALDVAMVKAAARSLEASVLINCVGLIRQRPEGREALPCVEVNSRLPHLLFNLAQEIGCRLIHYSTDCVFDGQKGAPYDEEDFCTAKDIYGLSKFLGEVSRPGALTLRTSVIGHELFGRKDSLLEWFLSQEGQIGGYTGAIYTGLPAAEHARILAERVLPKAGMSGLYQVASAPISKRDLLGLVAKEYGKDIAIRPDDSVQDDKRLSGKKFNTETGYIPPEWPVLVKNMHQSYLSYRS